VKRDVIPDHTASAAQGWYFNTRRQKFSDIRVREAFVNAFDFAWVNTNIMYGAYQRTRSVFENSDMMAVGPPGPQELALLEPFRGKVPEDVFGEPFVPPVSDGSGQDRALLRKASAFLQEAGYVIKQGKRVSSDGNLFTVEFLIDDPVSLPHHNAFIKNLGILGIEANVRVVDPVQYRRRLDDFDFDIVVQRFGFSGTPGDTLRAFFTSRSAAIRGTHNVGGIADPIIDALVETVIAANSRTDLITACKALDRVIRSGRYWVPHWYKPARWIAYWDAFGRPPVQPRYGHAIPQTWWSNVPS